MGTGGFSDLKFQKQKFCFKPVDPCKISLRSRQVTKTFLMASRILMCQYVSHHEVVLSGSMKEFLNLFRIYQLERNFKPLGFQCSDRLLQIFVLFSVTRTCPS